MFNVKFYEVFAEEERRLKAIMPHEIKAEYCAQTVQKSGDTDPIPGLISIRTQSVVPSEWAETISGILSRSQGFDHLKAYQKRASKDIPLGYLGKYCSRAVAEHAIMVSLNLIKNLRGQINQFGAFQRDRLTGLQAYGRKALVVGVGGIGQEIVKIANGWGMNVKGVDIAPKTEDIEYLPLEDGIGWAEIIYCALPLTEQTRGLLNYDLFKNAGSAKYLINISRGEITLIADMSRLLDEKILAGLGADVFENESHLADTLRSKEKNNDPHASLILAMSKRDNIIFTPHNAFNTVESLEEKSRNTVLAVKIFFKDTMFPYQIQTESEAIKKKND